MHICVIIVHFERPWKAGYVILAHFAWLKLAAESRLNAYLRDYSPICIALEGRRADYMHIYVILAQFA